MKVLRFILQKEFRQIIRDKTIIAMMFAVPIVQLVILPLAADFEEKISMLLLLIMTTAAILKNS